MFIHSRKTQFRAAALVFGSANLYMATLLNPLTIATTNSTATIILWLVFLFLVGMFGFCVYLWHMARTFPNKPLPDPRQWGGPNHIPASTRILNTVGSFALFTYGTYGVYINDLFLPGKRGSGSHLTGISAWFMYAAMLFAITNLLAIVVDHFDKRNNELRYAHITVTSQWFGWVFFMAALIWHLVASK